MQAFVDCEAKCGGQIPASPQPGQYKSVSIPVNDPNLGNVQRTFGIFIPTDYSSNTKLPLLMFFHGSGGKGSNGCSRAWCRISEGHPDGSFIVVQVRKEFTFLKILPCCPYQTYFRPMALVARGIALRLKGHWGRHANYQEHLLTLTPTSAIYWRMTYLVATYILERTLLVKTFKIYTPTLACAGAAMMTSPSFGLLWTTWAKTTVSTRTACT